MYKRQLVAVAVLVLVRVVADVAVVVLALYHCNLSCNKLAGVSLRFLSTETLV